MAVGFSNTNKPINPRGNDQSPKGYNRAALYSGKALDFDGVNDQVEVTTSEVDFGANSFSVSAIVDWSGSHTDGKLAYAERGSSGSQLAAWQIRTDGSGNMLFQANTAADGWQAVTFSGVEAIIADGLTHLTFVRIGTGATLYINGQFYSTGTGSIQATLDAANGNFCIGNRLGVSNYWNGKIGQYKIFSGALTAAQVADLYNNPEKVVPTGVADSALKLWLPMMEGAGTTAYDGSPVGFTEDIVTGFTNGTTYPLDSFASSGDDITTAIKTNGFGGCVSNGHYYTNGQKVKVKFTYQKNSGNDLRVLFSSLVTGAGTAKSDIQYVSASGEFEHTFTMTADGTAYLQLGTGNASHSIDAVITDVYVSPNVSANHGTISGATWTHGIGAPVAQTAVIDWNKGTNLITQTEAIADNWSLSGGTWSSGQDDPFGGTNAAKITATNSDPYAYRNANNGISSTQYTAKCWVKGDAGREARLWIIRDNIEFPFEDFTLTGDWQEIETTKTFGTTPVSFVTFRLDVPNDTPGAGDVAYIFAPRLVAGDNADVYVPTLANDQTSDVLLPQGLTTGRDITGVNLFENVRKQGALNLDGNSWAEVHKNDSIPEGDEGRTLECWFFGVDRGATQSYMETGNNSATNKRFGILTISSDNIYIVGQGYDTDTGVAMDLDAWNHVAVTHDGSTLKVYKNGSLIKTVTGRTYATANDDVVLGRNGSTGGEDSFGAIAQPRIYNRALTASEVLQNYNSGKNTYK